MGALPHPPTLVKRKAENRWGPVTRSEIEKLNRHMMHLKPGDQAPAFAGKDQHGQVIQLADFVGKKLALYFYPKDNTPGCTAEACDLRDNYHSLQAAGYEIVGVSSDSEASHQKFINQYNLPFRLIADTDHQIQEQYGVWIQKSFLGIKHWGTARTTFLIDEAGKIAKVIDEVKTGKHAAQIMG
jgi:peroxiredoxin Q/BCP